MTVIDSGQQKRLLKEKIRGSERKTERAISRVDLLSTAAYFGHVGQEPEIDPEG
jgi:hypothetical protein